jgi:class 3 adenylate cyclase
MTTPETKYLDVGDADVAYQVVGHGPPNLLYMYGLGAHLDVAWESDQSSSFMRRLAAFSRLIIFDRRGTGASDGVPRYEIPTWEEWTDDILAVLNETKSAQAAIFATLDAGPIAIQFAATHPERVSALILLTTTARFLTADDYPAGASPESIDAIVEMIATGWGTPEFMLVVSPSMSNDLDYARFTARMLRASATPRTAAAQFGYIMRSVDVRDALPLIQAPTLILHARDNPLLPIEHGRYLGTHISGAKFVEVAGGDSGISPENYALADEVAEFLTGERPTSAIERILTTIVFTDIVGSTARAASLGDQRWSAFLDLHERTVRKQVTKFRGREINTTGDGFVISFDGPARAIRCAQAIADATRQVGIEVRVGIHTGECEVRGDDLGGLAVHIAARVGALAASGEVLVSGTVKDLVVGSDIAFKERGEYVLKGVPGNWHLFLVGA